jgi:hypothetical protein
MCLPQQALLATVQSSLPTRAGACWNQHPLHKRADPGVNLISDQCCKNFALYEKAWCGDACESCTYDGGMRQPSACGSFYSMLELQRKFFP